MSTRGRRVGAETPAFVWVGALLALLFLLLPLVGLLKRVAWSGIFGSVTSGPASEALRLSLITSVIATVIALLLGLPLAWVLARIDFRGRSLVRALVMLPMVLPPVVGGVALLGAYGKSSGLVGGLLYDVLGLQLTYSPLGVVIAEAFVALPFLVMAVAVAWARALGEFGATITFAGNIEGRTQTTPLAVYLLLESDPEAAYALSFVLLAICVAVLVAMRGSWMGRRS